MEHFGFMWRMIRPAENVKLGTSEFHCPEQIVFVNKIFLQTLHGSPGAHQYTLCKGPEGISWAIFAFMLDPLAV